MAYSADDIRRIHRNGRIASLIGIEGGHQINNSLAALRQMYVLGARYMTLTHSLNNDWADSATDTPKHHGLTPFGREVVREMNRLGMVVDLSHVSAETMRAALETSEAPMMASSMPHRHRSRSPGSFELAPTLALIGENAFQSLAITASTAITFDTVGRTNPLAATTFCLMRSAFNISNTGREPSARDVPGPFVTAQPTRRTAPRLMRS